MFIRIITILCKFFLVGIIQQKAETTLQFIKFHGTLMTQYLSLFRRCSLCSNFSETLNLTKKIKTIQFHNTIPQYHNEFTFYIQFCLLCSKEFSTKYNLSSFMDISCSTQKANPPRSVLQKIVENK